MGSPYRTILLDTATHDLTLDANNNIAVADPPYAVAQDVETASLCPIGDAYYNASFGVDYALILNQPPSLSVIKAQFVAVAETVPDVDTAQVFITGYGRLMTLQTQFTFESTGTASPVPATFQTFGVSV